MGDLGQQKDQAMGQKRGENKPKQYFLWICGYKNSRSPPVDRLISPLSDLFFDSFCLFRAFPPSLLWKMKISLLERTMWEYVPTGSFPALSWLKIHQSGQLSWSMKWQWFFSLLYSPNLDMTTDTFDSTTIINNSSHSGSKSVGSFWSYRTHQRRNNLYRPWWS